MDLVEAEEEAVVVEAEVSEGAEDGAGLALGVQLVLLKPAFVPIAEQLPLTEEVYLVFKRNALIAVRL